MVRRHQRTEHKSAQYKAFGQPPGSWLCDLHSYIGLGFQFCYICRLVENQPVPFPACPSATFVDQNPNQVICFN